MSGNADGIRRIAGGVTAAKGFKTVSTATGIKYRDRKDMALIYSEAPCRSAGTFISNIVEVASMKWGKNQVTGSVPARTVATNAGIVDACTGEEDMGYCSQTADAVAAVLGTPAESALVASIGVIEKQLPMDKIKAGIEATASLLDGGMDSGTGASEAIMTTDTKNREVAVQSELGGVTVTMGGMCRGSGMTHPNIYTILSSVTTDVAISKEMFQEALSEDIKDTYNMTSVDGDTSTSGTVFLPANGLVGNEEIRGKNSDYQVFYKAFNYINETLVEKMAGDGEGRTVLLEVTIAGAKTKDQAKVLAKSVITPSLTKAAIFDHDVNWGRTLCAMGYFGVSSDLGKVGLFFKSVAGEMQIIKDSVAVDYSEEQATKILSQPQVIAVVDIKMGDVQATVWGRDLTSDYVKINADYRL